MKKQESNEAESQNGEEENFIEWYDCRPNRKHDDSD